MDWILDNGTILGKEDNKLLIPSVSEIYESGDTINIDGVEYGFHIENLRISRLIGLQVVLKFVYENERIASILKAIKGEKQYCISCYEGNLIGYCIIDNTWYYLDSDYDVIIEAFSKVGICPNQEINYFKYIELTKELSSHEINYFDEVCQKIDNIKQTIEETRAPELNDILFPYQKSGVNWLSFMSDGCCGCILGDEMGLGKTLQVIGLISVRKHQKSDSHFLIVAPISLLINWRREIEKFCPGLTTIIHHGSNRTGFYEDLLKYDIVITSYGNVQTDLSMINMINWDMLIVDEAQGIKNPRSKRRKYVNEVKRRMTIAMTGTPFENHVSDIWSISDFVISGYLGTLSEFESKFNDDIPSATEIEKMLSPIMIRRKVCEVAGDLPEKVDISQPIAMSEEEANYYENERNELEGKAALNQIRIDLIQGLRMFCSHPMVYRDDLDGVDPTIISNKYSRTCEILEEIISYGEKALIFTSFNKMISIFCEDIPRRFGIPTRYINGDVSPKERQKIIDEFSIINGPAVLVLNPKAAGAGLNITSANHVIHYNLEWNPAVESQASARAYRRGQDKTVFIYRLFYVGTIEQFVNEKIENKQEIFDTAIVGNKGDVQTSDLIKVLGYSPRKAQLE